jgi:hypothetical protein
MSRSRLPRITTGRPKNTRVKRRKPLARRNGTAASTAATGAGCVSNLLAVVVT